MTVDIGFHDRLVVLEVHRLPNQQIDVSIYTGTLVPPALRLLTVHSYGNGILCPVYQMISNLYGKARISAGMAIQVYTVYPHYRITENALEFNKYAFSFPFGFRHELLAIPSDGIYGIQVGTPFRHEVMVRRIRIGPGKGVGKRCFLQGKRPIVGKLHRLPITVVIKTCRCACRIAVLVKPEGIERIQGIFKRKEPILIESDFFHNHFSFRSIYLNSNISSRTCQGTSTKKGPPSSER